MLNNTKLNRAFKVTSLLTALFLIPLLSLYFFLKNYVKNEEKKLLVETQEKLRNEMNRFSSDLVPKNYITSAFQALHQHIGVENKQIGNGDRKLFKENTNEPYFGHDYNNVSKNFLKTNYGFEPFLSIYLDKPMPISHYNKIIDSVKIYELNKKNSIFGKNIDKKNFIKVFLDLNNNDDDKQFYNIYLSPVAQKPLPNNIAHPFFSGKFGYQLTYDILGIYLTNKPGQQPFDYFCVNPSDIDLNIYLKNVLCSNYNINIKRSIYEIENKSNHKFPIYKIIGDNYCLLEDFPTCMYMQAQFYKVKSNDLSNKLENILNNSCLKVSINKQNLVSHYRKWVLYLKYILAFIVILLVYSFIITYLGKRFKTFKISGKLKISIIGVIIFPIIGLFLITENIKNNEKSIITAECLNKMQAKISILNKIFIELKEQYLIETQKLKKIYSDKFLQNYRNDNLNPPIHHSFSLYENQNNHLITESRIFSNDIRVYGNYGDETVIFKEADSLPYFKIYSSLYLGIIEKLSSMPDYEELIRNKNSVSPKYIDIITRRHKLDTVYSVTSEWWDERLTNKRLNADGFIRDYYSHSDFGKDKFSFNLLSEKEQPFNAKTLLIAKCNTESFLERKILDIFYKGEFASEQNELYNINYGIFIRKSISLQSPINNISGYNNLLNLANITLNDKASKNEITDNTIDISKFITTLPVIIVAHADLYPNKHNTQDYLLVFLILLLYTLLTSILLSDVMSAAFISPIKTLRNFVDDIKNSIFSSRTKINTKDEIENLGNSLNLMAEDLEKREKMRRFVSEELYNKSKKDESENTTSAIEQTVTVLSSDIRSFTTISEQNKPEDIVTLLNDYFTEMEAAITKYGGTIEKIIGDAIFAIFTDIPQKENSGLRAIKAALEMRQRLKKFNEVRQKNNLFTIENGIGLATGSILTGFAGKSSRKREFVLIGNVIHSAEYLESCTKQGQFSKVYIDDATEKMASDNVVLSEIYKYCNAKEVISIKNE